MMSRQKEKRDKMMVGEKLADFLIDVAVFQYSCHKTYK